MMPVSFSRARPVWGDRMFREMNVTLRFSCPKPAGALTLRISAYAAWQLFLDGTLLAAGPARAGHGYFRVDEIPMPEAAGEIAVLIAGYNSPSYAYPDAPPFLCAELYDADGTVIAATGCDELPGFSAVRYTARIQKVSDYTLQRSFAEAYRFEDETYPAVPVVFAGERQFIAREVPYPEYEVSPAASLLRRGTFTLLPHPGNGDGHYFAGKGFTEREETLHLTAESRRIRVDSDTPVDASAAEIPLSGGEWATADLGRELTGFLAMDVECAADARLFVHFDEYPREKGFPNNNLILFELAPGSHRLLTMEPYALKYIRLAATAPMRVRNLRIVRYEFPSAHLLPKPDFRDEKLSAIYDAAVASFRQNTVDIYMDCPGRERAGWLCDSFFTARAEYELTGRSTVEAAFLDNFLQPASFANLPAGMLPMCYPSDHRNGNFIPNWAMWYGLELEEYLHRSGDRALIERARNRMYDLVGYFRRLENSDGLLSRLEGWVFVEWSRCNDLTQDINYPSNMLYASFKDAIGRLYGDETLRAEAAALRETIRHQAFTGTFFCDNAIYGEDGAAVLSGECTETCQYYAFFTGVATPELYPALWETMVRDFGPYRDATRVYPEIAPSNAFIGDYLRLELLFRAEKYDEVIENIRGYFTGMADATGTLWEFDTPEHSCNHGFTSYATVWLRHIRQSVDL